MSQKCAKVCDCNVSTNNTGIGCTPVMKVEKRPWIMNQTKADGSLNYIDLTVALDNAYFTGLINNADPLARLYPLPEIKNITDARDKPVVYAWKDGTEVFVRDGIRKFEGMFPPDSASPQLTGILEGERCSKPAKFSIDADGTIWGRISADGTKLYPVLMDAQSVAAIFTKPTDTEPQMIGYSFNFHPSEKDCILRGLPVTELTGEVDPLTYDGLMDVFMKVVDCTTNHLTVKLTTIFGTALNPLLVASLIVGEFSLYNVTTSAAIGLTGLGSAFAEISKGVYKFTYKTADDPASGNVLKLTPVDNGYDFTAVVATAIVVA